MPRSPTLASPPADTPLALLARPQSARARIAIGPFAAEAQVEVTPIGLLAAGALVSAILLSVVPIVRAATTRHPLKS
jgi:hypothetical protein